MRDSTARWFDGLIMSIKSMTRMTDIANTKLPPISSAAPIRNSGGFFDVMSLVVGAELISIDTRASVGSMTIPPPGEATVFKSGSI